MFRVTHPGTGSRLWRRSPTRLKDARNDTCFLNHYATVGYHPRGSILESYRDAITIVVGGKSYGGRYIPQGR